MFLHSYSIDKVRTKFKNVADKTTPYHEQKGFPAEIDTASIKCLGWTLLGHYNPNDQSYHLTGGWRYSAPLKYTNGKELWAPKDAEGHYNYGFAAGFYIRPVMNCCGTLQFQSFEGCHKEEEAFPVLEAALDWLWGNNYTYALAIIVPPSKWVKVMEGFPENVHLISQDTSRRTKHTLNLYKLYAKAK